MHAETGDRHQPTVINKHSTKQSESPGTQKHVVWATTVVACTCVLPFAQFIGQIIRVSISSLRHFPSMARTKQTAKKTLCGIAPRVQFTHTTRSKTRLIRGMSVASTASLSSLTTVPSSPARSLNDTLEIVQVDQQRLDEHPTNRVHT